jgi:glycosyltransferase involved in cell wall biosynthesis
MRVLLWHGYLLRGTGSNIYKANIVREWRRAGHDVMLLCQEHDVDGLEFVDTSGDFGGDNSDFSEASTAVAPAAGRVTLLRPDIGRLLPVYVYDDYAGFTVKRYVDLSEEELDRYVEANVAALRTAVDRFRPDLVFTGHEVMGPYIAKRAGMPFVAQLHGSALEYAVKEQQRYLEYAREGLCGAALIVGGSEYMVHEASSVVPGWSHKATVVNPGCDAELFEPVERAPDAVVGYVGKFIMQKGVHNFLAALPLTRTADIRAVVVGFGELDGRLRRLWESLQAGDLAAARESFGDGALQEFLASSRADDAYLRRAATIAVEWPGRLDHGPLSKVLPYFDVLVVPSVLAEAFGMVGAEAAACGVLPIVPNHSGIAEVGAAVEEAIGQPALLTFDHTRPIESIAERIDAVLAIAPARRREMRSTAAELAHERWSWSTVASTLIERATEAIHNPGRGTSSR